MINKNDSATTRVHWDSLTQDEQNLLLSVNALQKPEPGQQIEHSFHWLQAMGQPLDSQSQQLLNAHNPARYVPNYVGERKEARKAVQQFFEREDIDALLATVPGGASAEEAKQVLLLACEQLDPDMVCQRIAFLAGLVYE